MESQDKPKTGPLAPVSWVVNAQEKFLKIIKSATPLNTWYADMEKIFSGLEKNQTSHNFP